MIKRVVNTASVLLLLTGSLTGLQAQDDDIQELKAIVNSLQSQVEQYREEVTSLREALSSKGNTTDNIGKIKSKVHGVYEPELEKPTTHSKYDMRFYGYFKGDIFHDTNARPHQEIAFWSLQGVDGGAALDLTARQTRFGFETTAQDINGGTLSGKLEMDFYGKILTYGDVSGNHAYQLRTRHAYLQWKNKDWTLLAGKTFEAYTLEFPETLNFSYYNFQGQLGHRRMQLRASRFFDLGGGSKLEITGAIDEPVGGVHGGDLDGNGLDDGAASEVPGLVWRSKYTFKGIGGRPTVVGFGGFYAQEEVYGREYDAFATILSASIPLTDSVSLKGSIWQGENLDSAWGGIGQGINTSLNREIAATGGWVQLKIKPSAKYWFNLGYSVDDAEDDDLNVGQRTKNESYLANAYIQVSDPLLVAFELFQTETGYKGFDPESNTRLMGSVIFNF